MSANDCLRVVLQAFRARMDAHEYLRTFEKIYDSSRVSIGTHEMHTKRSRKTSNVRHPRSHSCNYHCRAPHTEGHLEPEKKTEISNVL